ncbi:glycoprotein-N-acetylgalactosamine 3-beta-galactosyltransferase 1-A-like isoform X1 [Lethenteron reissneri]|uniref:glycoprotein-N-acetylgalactosamine 3-beta-galactosyltransferase 1-A-like isoform X1 n=1 Tax=Lethenteron reissneri TaxID=7753 RepID=UPI002AB61123|nr:glycoprotein-N-acetylgalactosamine 3-beta-galactosyltransferase 1-A-like isoform X1 [Lethenteron reissneri]
MCARDARRRSWLLLAFGWLGGFSCCYFYSVHARGWHARGWHAQADGRRGGPLGHGLDASSRGGLDNSTAEALSKRVRLLCWIMVDPKSAPEKIPHIKASWAKRCDVALFMSSQADDVYGTIGLRTEDAAGHNQYCRTVDAFKYVHRHHLHDIDWVLKAEDDTFVIVENLKLLLSNYSAEQPIFFGRRFKYFVKQGYMSGGSGYVLSRRAVSKLVEAVEMKACNDEAKAEDVGIAACLEKIGVVAGESRDLLEREAFHGVFPEQLLTNEQVGQPFWYKDYSYHPLKLGPDCCSDFSISFHFMAPEWMYAFEYFAYHLRPYGYQHRPTPIRRDYLWDSY